MEALRVGIIGLGQVAEVHLQAYRQIENIHLVAGAEPRAGRLAQMAEAWDLTGYQDFEEMLQKEQLDIACILTPASTHRAITEKVAGYGVHVLCEKPMALTVEDCRAMIDVCNKEKVKFYYGSSYRYLPAVRKAWDMVNSGVVGNVQLLMETIVGGRGIAEWQPLSEHHYPLGGPGGGGLGLIDHGIHLADIFRWFAGSEARSVHGRGNISGQAPNAESLVITFENNVAGVLVYCDSTFYSDMPQEGIFSWGLSYDTDGTLSSSPQWEAHPGTIRIHGDRGALRIFPYANKLYFFGKNRQEPIRVQDKPFPGNFGLQIESFANSILQDREPEVIGLDGMKALEIVLAAYK